MVAEVITIQNVPAEGIKKQMIFSGLLKFFLSYYFVPTKGYKVKLVCIQFHKHISRATPQKLTLKKQQAFNRINLNHFVFISTSQHYVFYMVRLMRCTISLYIFLN